MESRISTTYPQPYQVADSVPDCLPLLPITTTQTTLYPTILTKNHSVGVAYPGVAHPPAHVLRELR